MQYNIISLSCSEIKQVPGKYEIEQSTTSEGVTSKLTIQNSIHADFKDYKCKLANQETNTVDADKYLLNL